MAILRKSYSNYIIRRKRQLTSKGSVYERDWMTVSELDGFAPGTAPVYASGNFKMTINNERSGKKRYSFSNWILNDSGETEWNLTDIDESKLKIRSELIKPNYNSLLDFACYGSAERLIYGSINDIYEKYPAELYGLGKHPVFFIGQERYESPMYYVENPFAIDVHSHYVKEDEVLNPLRYMVLSWDKYELVVDDEVYDILSWTPGEVYNDYCFNGDKVYDNVQIVVKQCTGGTHPEPPVNKTGRIISPTKLEIPMGNDSKKYYPELQTLTYDVHEYNFDPNSGVALEPIPPEDYGDCLTITFSGIYVNGKVYMVSDSEENWHIRLKKEYIDESFDRLDDFEKVLLNRDTKPKYKSTFYTPKETDTGVVTSLRSYIWPTLASNWNLDMETDAYDSYVNGLLYIATYYDDIRSDNLWRSYTHESIKNFDWTTPRETYVPEMDGHLIDTERMEAMIKVCGRQFDDLKRYIENIKYTVNVSYDSKNNMPDAALAKFLEMSGWEVKNVAPVDDNSLVVIDEYPGLTVKNTPEEANNEFLKRMILNSRNILSKKGTRAGIEAMYSMFGIFEKRYGNEYYFTIDEFDAFSNNYICGDTYDTILLMNKNKNGFFGGSEAYYDEFAGLMCEHKIDIEEVQYLVPWYDPYEAYDGRQYFQMMGGWGKRQRKTIYLPDLSSGTSELHSVEGEFEIYDETVKNIKVSDNFTSLNSITLDALNDGDVYYVIDISDAYSLYGCNDETDYSNYVIFYERNTNTVLPDSYVPYSDNYAWYLVAKDDFNLPEENMPWYAKKILYMESIHDNSIGNNPHNGNNLYDGGKEFFEFYTKLFKGSLERDLFSLYRARNNQENARRHYENRFRVEKLADVKDDTVGLEDIGFNLTIPYGDDKEKCVDNEKIWYFLSYDNGIYESDFVNFLDKRQFGCDDSYEPVTDTNFPLKVDNGAADNCDERSPLWNTPITAADPEDSTIAFKEFELNIPEEVKSYYDGGFPDETVSYSVINTKNMRITYHMPWELEDYVTDVVEFYVKQLIPSTAIVEFVWDYTDGPRPAERVPYGMLYLHPDFQSIRSYESEADIGISSINIEGIEIEREETIEK